MDFLLTNDVECFSFRTNNFEDAVAQEVYKQGLPRLIDLYSKHDISCTFYATGKIVELKPEIVDLIKDAGHEMGCHSYEHTNEKALDNLTYEQQLSEIGKAKEVIENAAGRVVSFRAPALRINSDTLRVLEELGFETDSSIASQRFDGPMSFGSKSKINWITAPRKSYHPSRENPYRKGDSRILEVPVSAFVCPYIGTTMRASRTITKFLQKILFYESKKTGKPVVFIVHPNEAIDFSGPVSTARRGSGFVSHLFADRIRHRIKLKNLGGKTVNLLDELIKDAKTNGFEFSTVREYSKTALG
jgi:peptidoglycan/xylan/chitin deacetylase (PgdA/CDA1 family)